MDPLDPNAQVIDPNPQQELPQQGEVSPGLQARINELTARFHSAERRAEQDRAQYTQQLQQANQTQQELLLRLAQQQQQAPEDLPEIDGDVQAVMDRRVAAVQQQFQQQLQTMQSQMQVQQLHHRAQQLGVSPEVAARAEQLLAGWSRQGLTVATSQDALNFALGEQVAAQQAKGAIRPGVQQMQPQQPFQPFMSHGTPAPQGRPAVNLDTLTPEQQAAYFDKLGDVAL